MNTAPMDMRAMWRSLELIRSPMRTGTRKSPIVIPLSAAGRRLRCRVASMRGLPCGGASIGLDPTSGPRATSVANELAKLGGGPPGASALLVLDGADDREDLKSTRLNSSHANI